jgi:hypothetical protein
MSEAFAIYPDGDDQPSAWFYDLEDATDWALGRYGGDRFSIRLFVFTARERAAGDHHAAALGGRN